MELAMKRQKMAQSLTDTEEDELDLEPDELNERRDPAFQLGRKRAKAVNALKSRFEDIFVKYGKDFTGIGDEIDLSTGRVVVDNGHLSSLKDMKGWIVDDDEDDENEEDQEEQEQEIREQTQTGALPGLDVIENRPYEKDNATPRDPWQIPESSRASEPQLREPLPLASLRTQQVSLIDHNGSASPVVHESSVSADPNWQAPELPPSAFLRTTLGSSGGSKGKHYGGGTPVATRTALKSSLPAPENSEANEEDDLQLLPDNAAATKNSVAPRAGNLDRKSPLIKKKFPTIDSSPQDNNLTNLILDVIENIPDTPHSMRAPRVAMSQRKPSPLGHGSQPQSKTKSNLRHSDTPLNDSQEPPKKRGRPSKIRPESVMVEETLSGPSDQSPWNNSDLESYLDVTAMENLKPLGQALYIDIKARRDTNKKTATRDGHPDTHIKNMHTEGVGTSPSIHQGLFVQHSKSADGDVVPLDAQHENGAVVSEATQSNKLSKSNPQETFTMNVADPDFYFSDDETLLPRRRPKNKGQLEPAKPALALPRPVLKPDAAKQNDFGKNGQTAATYRQAVLGRGAAPSLRRQTILAAEAAEEGPFGSPTHVDSTPRTLPQDRPPTPEWIRERLSAQPETVPQAPQHFLSARPASSTGSRSLHRPITPSSQSVFESEAVDPNHGRYEELLSPSRNKLGISSSDPAEFADVLSPMETERLVPVEKQQPTRSLQSELTVEKDALKSKTRDVEAEDEALQTEAILVEIPAEEHTAKASEPQTPGSATGERKQRRRSERLSSKPNLVGKPMTLVGKMIVSRKCTRRASDIDTQIISPLVGTVAAPHSSDQQKERLSTKRLRLRGQSSAERVVLPSEQGVDLALQESSPVGQSAADCMREVSEVAAQGEKRTAQEALLDAEAGRSEAVRAAVAQQRTEVGQQPADTSSPAMPEASAPAAPSATQPVTPRRPKSRGPKKKDTPSSSFDTSLISLLSDSDDSEDEISFNHSDFTPAGHHRILVHQRFPQLPTTTTPRFSASSSSSTTKKKRAAASLLYRRPHSASSHKVSKTPRSATAARRRDSHQLARSVVRVVRRRDSDGGEREGSVVQTPGGTKRRCGVEGWKCDRDFCFVCM